MVNVALLITVTDGGGSSGFYEEFRKQKDALEAEKKYSFSEFLNDGGPDGYLKVWEKASGKGFGLYLWMEDDLRLSENALASLLENSEFLRHKAVIAGTVADLSGNSISGGRSRRGDVLSPDNDIPLPCQLYDLSLALVPEYVFSTVRPPSDVLCHGPLEFGYGAKVARAGVGRVVAPGVLARADRSPAVPAWRNASCPMPMRAKSLSVAVCREIIRGMRSIFG